MNIDLYYNGSTERVSISDTADVRVVEPQKVETNKIETQIIIEAISNPVDAPFLDEFINRYESFLVILNDQARNTPSPLVLEQLLPKLEDKRFAIIIACGTHGGPTEEDLKNQILGRFYGQLRPDLIIHDSKNADFVEMGTTGKGTKVEINKVIQDFDALIAVNSIEPHYFAGYTGGRKSIVPGIAKYETVEMNHSMALLESAGILNIENNPLHEDLEEAAGLVVQSHPTFGINLVVDGEGRVVGAVSGNIFRQLYLGAELAKEIYAPLIENKPDILVSVVHAPLDLNLYQAQKGFENCRSILKRGGVFILVAACPRGIGPEDYAQMLQTGDSIEDLAETFERVKQDYQLGWHKVGSIPPFLSNHSLWMVTKIPTDSLERMFVRGFETIQEALDSAIKEKGEDAQILIVQDSANVSPRSQS